MRFSLVSTIATVLYTLNLSLAASSSKVNTPFFGVRENTYNEPTFVTRDPQNILDATLSIRGGEVKHVTKLDEVQAILMKASAEGKLVVIDFSAEWCGPCKMIAPFYEELSELMPNVEFLKVDVDEAPDTSAHYEVSSLPCFIFIKKGDVVDKLVGASPPHLKNLLEQHA